MMMDFTLQMMNFVLKMMSYVGHSKIFGRASADTNRSRLERHDARACENMMNFALNEELCIKITQK